MRTFALTLLLFASLGAFVACNKEGGNAGNNAGGGGETTITKLRISGIPDISDTKVLTDNHNAVAAYLKSKLGIDVEYVGAQTYATTVSGLASDKLDLVWYGAVTAALAEDKCGKDNVTFVACRDIDLKFKSYFIAKGSLGIGTLGKLEDLKSRARDLKFTFGDENSTSGRAMPQYFLEKAGFDHTKDFKSWSFQPSGGHGATLSAVASGAADVGALNYAFYDGKVKDDPTLKEKAPIIYTTPEYVDYVWVAHNRIGSKLIANIQKAFLELKKDNPDEKKILDAFKAGSYVKPDPAKWDQARVIAKKLKESQ